MRISPITHTVSAVLYHVDRICRRELARSLMNAPQYVGALATQVRDLCRDLGIGAQAYSRGLGHAEENRFGCDALIVLKVGRMYKVCLFEAKWPRLGSTHTWDSKQKGSGFRRTD